LLQQSSEVGVGSLGKIMVPVTVYTMLSDAGGVGRRIRRLVGTVCKSKARTSTRVKNGIAVFAGEGCAAGAFGGVLPVSRVGAVAGFESRVCGASVGRGKSHGARIKSVRGRSLQR
jgi:hypothetical protein